MRILGLVLSIGVLWGCVERKLVVRSTPPGGVVLVDHRVVGVTPVTIPFTYYGARTVEVRWDPYLRGVPPFRAARETRMLYPPWYQVFPLDLVTELLFPVTFVDERVFSFRLQPAPTLGAAGVQARVRDVVTRAERLRGELEGAVEEGR